MQKRGDSTRCETDILESEPDIDEHKYRGNDNRHDGILPHLFTDGRADILRGYQRLIHLEAVGERLVQRLTRIQAERLGLNDNLVRVCNLLRLDIGIPGHFFHDRHDFFIYLFNRIIFVKCYICRRTAFKLQAVCKCSLSF